MKCKIRKKNTKRGRKRKYIKINNLCFCFVYGGRNVTILLLGNVKLVGNWLSW